MRHIKVIGREGAVVAHKFDPRDRAKLDRDDRKAVFPADLALGLLDLTPGSIVADIGCGTGYLSIPASRVIGETGRVYAVDTSKHMLDVFTERMREENLTNVTTVLSAEYDFRIERFACTHVIMSSVFHEVDEREEFAREALRILRPGGKLAVFEMKPGVDGPGPPDHHRIPPSAVEVSLRRAGFEDLRDLDMNAYFYCVTGLRGRI
jgi:ubiquinone/menaquinone biosynthesis C-methylase UbiE